MRVRLVRRPGQHGTRAYVEQYGDRLICVRYRYDEVARRRYKTIEIIVEEKEWVPQERAQDEKPPLYDPETRVGLRIIWGELELARRLRRARAIWRRDLQLWELAYANVIALELTDRIVGTIAELRAAQASKGRNLEPG